MFNIKDEKNTGLFRKILLEKVSARGLVSMSADDLASKELQQWRQAELHNDIEKIKTFELDKISHGDKFFIKSHKGDMVLEGDNNKETKVQEVKLPEEQFEKEKKKYKSSSSSSSSKHHSSSSSSSSKDRYKGHHYHTFGSPKTMHFDSKIGSVSNNQS